MPPPEMESTSGMPECPGTAVNAGEWIAGPAGRECNSPFACLAKCNEILGLLRLTVPHKLHM
jgi:hypothetical protein